MELQRRGPAEPHAISLSSEVQGIFIDIPTLKMGEDRFVPNPAASQSTKNAAPSPSDPWFHHALSPQIFRVPAVLRSRPRKPRPQPFRSRPVHALYFQIGDHAPAPKFLIIPAQGREVSGILRIVQIAAILESPINQLDQRLPVFRLGVFHPRAE